MENTLPAQQNIKITYITYTFFLKIMSVQHHLCPGGGSNPGPTATKASAQELYKYLL